MQKKKILVLLLVISLICGIAYFILSAKNERNIYKAEILKSKEYQRVEENDNSTQSDCVKFDAFFLRDLDGDGNADGIRGMCRKVGEEDTLYMELNVLRDGTLKNGKIIINSENFALETAIPKDEQIKQNAIGSNIKQIVFKDIPRGTQKLITGIVKSGMYNSLKSDIAYYIGNDISNYSKVNSVTLIGVFEPFEGEPIEINKRVEFSVDWHGEVISELPQYIGEDYSIDYKNQNKDIEKIFDEDSKEINLTFDIVTAEINNELNLKKAEIEVDIPKINGYKPQKVEILGNSNISYEYDEEECKLIAKKEAILRDDNIIGKVEQENYQNIRYNKFPIKITYSEEAYESIGANTISLNIPVSTYYEGFNNEFFDNPYKSNITRSTIIVSFSEYSGSISNFELTVGENNYIRGGRKYYVTKKKPLRIYNEFSDFEQDDIYTVKWKAITGVDGESSGIIMKSGEENFINNDGTNINMYEMSSNIGIYFSNPKNLLGNNWKIRVYDDETNELLITFTEENWRNYSLTNPYLYDIPVKSIRVETSSTKPNCYMYVYNIKEIDDEYIINNFTKEEFLNLEFIQSTMSGYIENTHIREVSNVAHYLEPLSYAYISSDVNSISTQGIARCNINIVTSANNEFQEDWINGIFLIKFPKEVIDVSINSFSCNEEKVKILSCEQYEEDNINFIKLITSNTTGKTYTISLNCDITPDGRSETLSKTVDLFAINEKCENYEFYSDDIYDVNQNQNYSEEVAVDSYRLSFIAQGTLIANQIGNGAIAPKISFIEKEDQKANIDIQITNNYTNIISDVQIIGKVPKIGNTYAISKGDLESTFDTYMSSEGIKIPEELEEFVNVYYSELDNPSKENLSEWETKPDDWTKIKTFLIDLGEYNIPINKTHIFSYEIELPDNLEYYQISYSHFGAYFNINTEGGKYMSLVEPSKLGFMVSKVFDIEITKYQKGTENIVSGAIYSIIQEDTNEVKTKVTNSFGKLFIKDLCINKTYIIKEIRSPEDYKLNNENIKFKIIENENNELETQLLEGRLRENSIIRINTENKALVMIQVEDETCSSLKIIKSDKKTNEKLSNVKYQLKELSQNIIKTTVTDSRGEAIFTGLNLEEEYILEETKADGYMLADKIKFVVKKENEDYYIEFLERNECLKNNYIETTNGIPTINFIMENEKAPTLKIIKKDKETKENLELVRFSLSGKGFGENGKIVTTNSIGEAILYGLYTNTEYILKEVVAEGYYLEDDIKFIIRNVNEDYSIEFLSGQVPQNDIEIIDGEPIISFEIENIKIPNLKITKIEKETNKEIPDVNFILIGKNGEEEFITTDENGNIEIDGSKIYLNQEHTLIETKAEGYFLEEPIKFIVNYTNGDYEINITAGNVKDRSVEKTEGLTTIKFVIENEKIPTYDLEVTKIESKGEVLEGAEFEIYKDNKKIGNYITDENGQFVIENLYQSIEDRGVDGKYVLKEILAPSGYLRTKDIKFKVVETNNSLEFLEEVENLRNYTVEGNKIKLVIEDKPSFKIIKQDGESKIGLAGVKFSIYKIENGEEIPARDGKGNIIGKKEVINNKEYYVVVTDENGEIVADLQEGLYKAIEIESLENYELTENEYFFGIGESQEAVVIPSISKINNVKYRGENAGINTYLSTKTEDGGYLVQYEFSGNEIQIENEIISNISTTGDVNSILVKYNNEGNVDAVSFLGASEYFSIDSIIPIENGYLVDSWQSGVDIKIGDELIHLNNHDYGRILVEYNKYLEVENIIYLDGFSYIYQYTIDNGSYILAIRQLTDFEVKGRKIYFADRDIYDWGYNFFYDNQFDIISGMTYEEFIQENPTVVYDWYNNSNNIYGEQYVFLKINGNDVQVLGKMQIDNYNYRDIRVTKDRFLIRDCYTKELIEYDFQGNIVANYRNETELPEVEKFLMVTSDGGKIYVKEKKYDSRITISERVKADIQDEIDNGIMVRVRELEEQMQDESLIDLDKECIQKELDALDEEKRRLEDIIENGSEEVGTKYKYLKYDKNKNKEWEFEIDGETEDVNIYELYDGSILAVSYNNIIHEGLDGYYYNFSKATVVYSYYSSSGNLRWRKNMRMENFSLRINDVSCSQEGNVLLNLEVFPYWSDENSEMEIGNETISDANLIFCKIDKDGDYEFIKLYERKDAYDMCLDSKGEYAVLNENFEDDRYLYFIEKYDLNNELIWKKDINEIFENSMVNELDIIKIKQDNNGDLILIGFTEDMKIYANLEETEIERKIDEIKELVVENFLKTVNITTEIKISNGEKGGTISGENEKPYEKVIYGNSNTKEINVKPKDGYKIMSIKVNGEEYLLSELIKNEDESYSLKSFNNLIENKHIVVEFGLEEEVTMSSRVIVHYFLKDTEIKLEKDTVLRGIVGEPYTTSPYINIEKDGVDYELEKDDEGEYIVPENSYGIYKNEDEHVNYYYEEKIYVTSQIEKLGPNEINKLDEILNYEIKYQCKFNTIFENKKVEVIIIDDLPCKIDTSKEYDLDGGEYNEEENTIRWVEIYDTQLGTNELEIKKDISFSYKDIESKTIINKVTGIIKLPNKTMEEVYSEKSTSLDLYGNIKIKKIDGINLGQVLGGAEFKLERLEYDAENLIVDEAFEALVGETSSETGILEFKDLKQGHYRLTEIKAPIGYNLKEKPIDILLDEDNLEYSCIIKNLPKSELPSTGGKGNIMIYMGILVIGLSVLHRKRE